jgi:hypothetical protein
MLIINYRVKNCGVANKGKKSLESQEGKRVNKLLQGSRSQKEADRPSGNL